MAVVEQLIRAEKDGSISFGNYLLPEKKLESNENFVYESVPGTAVTNFKETENGVSFGVEGENDAQITLGLLENTEYSVFVNGTSIGKMSTNLGGKLNLSVELSGKGLCEVRVEK